MIFSTAELTETWNIKVVISSRYLKYLRNMSSRSKEILSMVLKEPGIPDNGTLVDSNNIQNIEVITEDGFLLTSLDYSLEDSLQPKFLNELTNLIPLDDNLNISQHQIPIQNICQSQGGNANKGCFEFIKVSGPFQEGENEPEHMEERESEQEPTEDDGSELKHTENSENEAQHSEEDRRTQSAKKKIDYDSEDAYIESFQPFISHYRREHAPNRRYLPSDISISVMFETFKSQYPDMKASYEAYRLRVKAKKHFIYIIRTRGV
ncbi:hypothetical protein JTB14_009691 [Gonioctena quinquepunctata]|nr:hypothetical protein JTB14_009691 [Gonioctena quinquepunctata]